MSEPELGSDPVIEKIYQRFRALMPDLPEDYNRGLADWRLVRTAAAGIPWDGRTTTGVIADLTFSNGLEYHGRVWTE